jgi:hypothetical protein
MDKGVRERRGKKERKIKRSGKWKIKRRGKGK